MKRLLASRNIFAMRSPHTTSTIIHVCVSSRDIQAFCFVRHPLWFHILHHSYFRYCTQMNNANRFNLASNHLHRLVRWSFQGEGWAETWGCFPQLFFWVLVVQTIQDGGDLTCSLDLFCLASESKFGRLPRQGQNDNERHPKLRGQEFPHYLYQRVWWLWFRNLSGCTRLQSRSKNPLINGEMRFEKQVKQSLWTRCMSWASLSYRPQSYSMWSSVKVTSLNCWSW
jgi:hypothetical protein